MLRTLDNMVLQRNDVLTKVHPFDPASVPNFIKGLKGKLPPTCPESLHESEAIQLMVGTAVGRLQLATGLSWVVLIGCIRTRACRTTWAATRCCARAATSTW